MSRLYAILNTDMVQEVTRRGNEDVEFEVLWGSKKEPKTAVRVRVQWYEGMEKPKVSVRFGDVIKEVFE